METTAETGPRTGRSTRASGGEGGRSLRTTEREEQYDLLTAALLGVAVGAAAALLVNAAVPRRDVHPVRRALRQSGKIAVRGGRAAMAAPEAVREQLGEYLSSAREAIADTVESELKDLRRAIRRRRRRLGL